MPALGWNPLRSPSAVAEVVRSRQYSTVDPLALAKAMPAAWSLTGYRVNWYDQKQAGTCWTFSPKMLGEILGNFNGYKSYSICNMLVGWYVKNYYEGGGNQANGGAPTDAVRAMCKGGCGIGHDDKYPYTDDPRVLASRPPQEVWDDASGTFFRSPVIVQSIDQVKPLLLAGSGICTGIPWPGNWEEPRTFHSTLGQIVGGHSELMVGWADPGVFDEYGWLEMENWRPLPYPPLPPSLAKLVQGYEPVRPDRTNSQWIRQDVFLANRLGQITEFVSAVDIAGMDAGIVIPALGFGSDSWI